MQTLVLVGLQWGDEGKGKVVDILSSKADLVIRFQGGSNAGHTIEFDDKKFVLHQVPSGILNPQCQVFLGSGMVIDLWELNKEIAELQQQKISCKERIFISELAHLILPIHKIKDAVSENKLGKNSIGTTKKGIGPAYVDKVCRQGIRVCELAEDTEFYKKFIAKMEKTYLEIESDCQNLKLKLPNIEQSYQQLMLNYQKLKNNLRDPLEFVQERKKTGAKILLEGAQGSLLDLDYGSYPFVTSSNTIAGGAAIGSGLSIRDIDGVLGLFKAYTTRVGQGPFPTELNNKDGKFLQNTGNEYGATTGRNRRCGWLDLCLLRKTMLINGVSYLGIMKLDVLDFLEQIKVCTHYKLQGKNIATPPNNTSLWQYLQPQYQTFTGWQQDTSKIKTLAELPKNCKNYIKFLQKELKSPIVFLSNSPKKENYILTKNFF